QRLKDLEAAAAQAAEAKRLKALSAAEAREQAFHAEKAEWDRIKNSRNVDDFYAFVKAHPSGGISDLAQSRIEMLQKAQVQVQPDREGKVQASWDMRYRDGDRHEFIQRDGLTGVQNGRGVIEVKVVGEDEVEGVVISGN